MIYYYFCTGSCLLLLWRVCTFILTLSLICNLRAHLLKPASEHPIDTDNDILTRGANLWVRRVPFDFTAEKFTYEDSMPYFLNLLSRKMQDYVMAKNTEYILGFSAEGYIFNEEILQDVLENGAVVVSDKVSIFLYRYNQNRREEYRYFCTVLSILCKSEILFVKFSTVTFFAILYQEVKRKLH